MSRLVSAKEMLTKAKAGKYAVGQFNINNLEWTKSILQTAQELQSPVILGVSEGAGKYMCGYKTVVGMVEGMLEELDITVPVALHLDHGSFEGAKACINAGFSSIMFDGSSLPIDENVQKTTELVNTCNILGLSLEAEVGQSVEKKTELSVPVSVQILMSVRKLQTSVLQCLQQVSEIFMVNILKTGQDLALRHLMLFRLRQEICLSFFTVVQESLLI